MKHSRIFSIAVVSIVAVCWTSALHAVVAAKPVLKVAPTKSVAAKVSLPASTQAADRRRGTAVRGVPAAGSSKVSVTLCPEETEPATFSVRYAKSMSNVRASAAGDFVGPGQIPRANIEVSRVDCERLINSVSPSSGSHLHGEPTSARLPCSSGST